jgi:hypothetical protein
MNNIEVRAIPKKTFVYIGILLILGVLAIILVKDGKAQKVTKILTQLGYTNVTNVSVATKTKFINEDTNVNGFQYAVKFTNIATHQECRGFVIKDFKGVVAQDLDCK